MTIEPSTAMLKIAWRTDLVSAGHVVVKTAGPIEKSFDGIRHVD